MDVPAIASSNPPAAATAVAEPSATANPVVPAAAAAGVHASEPTMTQITDAVKKINQSMSTQSRGLEFSVDTDSKRTVVKVVDRQTNELIRQIPTVETLQIAHALDQAQGLLIKQQA